MSKIVIRNLRVREVIDFLQRLLDMAEVADMTVNDEENTVLFRPVEDEETEMKNIRITDDNIQDLI